MQFAGHGQRQTTPAEQGKRDTRGDLSAACSGFAISADEVEQDGWAMDIEPVDRLRSVERVGVRLGPGDVTPALGAGGVARMEDDSYQESRKNQDRGMDEEAEVTEQSADESGPEAGSGKKKGVNCFA